MLFPETIEEFIDSFSFKDTEEVYTNGAQLIPVFRVHQALEHYYRPKTEKEQRTADYIEEVRAKEAVRMIPEEE